MPSGSGSSGGTNPSQWLQANHWEAEEVIITVSGAAGQKDLGVAVAAGKTRRVREYTINHTGTNNTDVSLLIKGGATKVTVPVPAQTGRVWGSDNGRKFIAGQITAVQSSDVTGGTTRVSASGVEK